MEYRQKLVEQWKSDSTVRRVAERRHMPQSVHSAVKLKREMLEARKVKEDRRRKHTKAGREKPKPERKSEYGFSSCQVAVRGPQTSSRLLDQARRLSSLDSTGDETRITCSLGIGCKCLLDFIRFRVHRAQHTAWERWRRGPAVAAPRQKWRNLLTTNRGHHRRTEVDFSSLVPHSVRHIAISRARDSPFSCCTLHAITIKPTSALAIPLLR